MKLKIVYISSESAGFQVEKFNSEMLDFSIISKIDEIKHLVAKETLDVLILDEDFSSVDSVQKIVANSHAPIKVYFVVNDSKAELIKWAIQQEWIDKVIPSNNQNFVINDSVIKTITKDSALLMDYKQLLQDNRELEFVISQMMLVD